MPLRGRHGQTQASQLVGALTVPEGTCENLSSRHLRQPRGQEGFQENVNKSESDWGVRGRDSQLLGATDSQGVNKTPSVLSPSCSPVCFPGSQKET